MMRFWVATALLALISILWLSAVPARGAVDPTSEPTPTVQPTSDPFEVEVVVETEGIGIPDDVVMETDLGDRNAYRHEDLGPNHYRDFLKVRLDSAVMWIFEHEGDLGVGGQRNDESWVLVPYIVPTPLTLTVLIHNPTAPCQDPTMEKCNDVSGIGDKPTFTLEHNKSYDIHLRVEYTRGDRDSFTVTSTIE